VQFAEPIPNDGNPNEVDVLGLRSGPSLDVRLELRAAAAAVLKILRDLDAAGGRARPLRCTNGLVVSAELQRRIVSEARAGQEKRR
jgi:hypothetical protein